MHINVLWAVFRRNFVSYFANPTGYIFICVFVLLSSIAAFWPNEFFNANLANLDQLNNNPYLNFFTIMLVFIPAITMGIWSDERRQGTDELLLTVPARDFDIVLGKYLAAVAIFSVALLFSLACNFAVLKVLLGDPDIGLFLATYAGYWMIGLAMLALGMVASFLTANVTIAFVLGVIFNAPLVLAAAADAACPPWLAPVLKSWSLGAEFRDFSRGIISVSAIAYFLLIVMVMLYLSMILIGRRHWRSGWQQNSMALHYAVRVLALAVIAVGLTMILQRNDARLDMTSEHLSSLSPQTRTLLADLKLERPVQIEAFISPTVPEAYVQTRLNLLAMLDELKARGGGKVRVQINDTERFSEEAARAERRFGITPRRVETQERGAREAESIFMGVALTSGLQKVILPFIDRGIPVEYELVRSLSTVAQQKRRRVGILNTDAQLFGRINFQTMSPGTNWPIVDELQKQYEVVQVDPSKPITDKFDVLLAVQPSTLTPEAMDNFLAAVKSGQPTAIFEDPCPALVGDITPTSMPRRPPPGMNPMMMMGQQPQPKGDIGKLWTLLGVDFSADQIVWQKYNPYPKVRAFPEEFVFVDSGEGSKTPFSSKDDISAKLQQVLLPFPGWISKLNASDLEFIPLMRTGDKTGTVPLSEIMDRENAGGMRHQSPTNTEYVLGAHIRGKLKPDAQMAGADPQDEPPAGAPSAAQPKADKAKADKTDAVVTKLAKPAAKPTRAEVNVVLVADVDMISPAFFQLREQNEIPELGIRFDFDNVTFVLNTLDELAGDDRFIDIRSRRPKHRTLTRIEERTEASKLAETAQRDQCYKECDKKEQEEQAAFDKKMAELQSRKDGSSMDMLNEVAIAMRDGQRRMESTKEQLHQKRDREVNKIETKLALDVRHVQNQAKWLAVLLPPIPPLMLGLMVFFTRRQREREGVSRKRLR